MKKIVLALCVLLMTSCVYAAPPVTLVGGNGEPMGSPSNPVSVQFSGDINTTSDITTTGNVTANAFISNGTGVSTINQGLNVYGPTNSTGFLFRGLSNTSVDRVTILDNGNVGIGTTAPSEKFTLLQGNILLDRDLANQNDIGKIRWVENFSSNFFQGMYIFYDGAANEFSIGAHEASDSNTSSDFPRMVIERSGNVGIGTTAPVGKLEIWASANSFSTSIGGVNRQLLLGTDSKNNPSIQGYKKEDGSNQSLTLNPNGGSVGIGTTTPTQKLTISGAGSGIRVDDGAINMTSPDGTTWNCRPANTTGVFTCS